MNQKTSLWYSDFFYVIMSLAWENEVKRERNMLFGMTYYQLCSYFLIYSFVGWIVEVIFHAVTLGKVINRGFLNGPVCPVYGFGMLSVLALVGMIPAQVQGRTMGDVWIFVMGTLLATAVELIAGWLLDVIFHARWWDYSDRPFNLHGYICLEFSLLWGVGILLIIRVFQVHVTNCTQIIPTKYGWILMAVLYTIYLVDLVVTVAVTRGLNKKLSQLDRLRSELRIVSDGISNKVGTMSIGAAQKVGAGAVQAELAKQELTNYTGEELRKRKEALQNRIEELSNSLTRPKIFGESRLLRAFPDMKHRDYGDVVEKLRERIKRS